MAEGDNEYVFIVRVRSYDRGDEEARRKHALIVSRALHSEYGPERFNVEDLDSTIRYAYDPLADDGHHPDHTTPLLEVPNA